MDFEFRHLYKIPNVLCYIRILLVPVFLYVYFTADTPTDYYLAAGIVLLSGITDFLDGQIARKYDMITDLGRLLDPIADKMMQLSMLCALTVTIKYMYVLVIFLVLKELITLILGLTIYKKCNKRLSGAKWYGKLCTAVLYAVMLALIAFPNMEPHLQVFLLSVSLGVLAMAWIMYTKLYHTMYKETKDGDSGFKTY